MRGTVLMPLVVMAVLVKKAPTSSSEMSSISNASGHDGGVGQGSTYNGISYEGHSLNASGHDGGVGQGSTY